MSVRSDNVPFNWADPFGMEGQLSEEERLVRDTAKQYAQEKLLPRVKEAYRNEATDPEIFREMGALGLLGSTIEGYDCAGVNYVCYGLMAREIEAVDSGYRSMMSVQSSLVMHPINTFGSEDQKQKYLPKYASGEWISCFCLTEPEAGSDAASLRTTARRDGDHYVINGTKRYITNAPVAHTFNVMARTDPEVKGARGISSFIVERDTPGITLGSIDKKMGQSGSMTCDVIFEDVRVPAENIIGEEGEGFITAMKVLDRGRLHISGVSIGVAKRLIADALDYAMQRKQFGQPIAEQQLIQAMLADSQTETYAAECMTMETARRRDRNENVSTESSACKLFCTEMVGRVADRAVQIHGGAGYMSEYAVERFYRDVRLFRLYEGTSQIQQIIIARNMIRAAS